MCDLSWPNRRRDGRSGRELKEVNVFVQIACIHPDVEKPWMIGKAMALSRIPEQGELFNIPGVGPRRVSERINERGEAILKTTLIFREEPLRFHEYIEILGRGWVSINDLR